MHKSVKSVLTPPEAFVWIHLLGATLTYDHMFTSVISFFEMSLL